MSLISNRKRPRNFSESFARTAASGGTSGAPAGQLLAMDYTSNLLSSSSSTDHNNIAIHFNDSIVIDDTDDSDNQNEQDLNGAYAQDPALDASQDDDEIVILEERQLDNQRLNSVVFLNDYEEESAYNMFNVHNVNANTNYNYALTKKQRTSSLPQLPQVRCFYNRILPEVIQKAPKLGNLKPPVIPCTERDGFAGSSGGTGMARSSSFSSGSSSLQSNTSMATSLVSCDDKEGHYVINIGESFADGRFFIVRLLGQGTFGKVVECVDRLNNEKVAIKIIRNIPKYRDAAKIELRILSTLKKFDYDNLNHCIHLKECFDYRGHICIVTDLLKILLYDFLERNKFISFPGLHIQAIAKQLIRSITFLHDLRLIHTDLKPENILLYDDSFTKKALVSNTIRSSYAHLKKNKFKKFPKMFKILRDPSIQIIDFGSAIFDDEYHSCIVSTRHYRAPEIILGIGWSFPCDMWSIGCILVELIIGEPLFRTHDNLEHLAMIEKTAGQSIDSSMVRASKLAQNECGLQYFDPDSMALDFEDNIETPTRFIESVEKLSRIDIFISFRLGLSVDFDYSLNENYERNRHLINFGNFTFWWFLIDLLRKLFIIDPNKRLTAWDALQHPWFNLGIDDEGTEDE